MRATVHRVGVGFKPVRKPVRHNFVNKAFLQQQLQFEMSIRLQLAQKKFGLIKPKEAPKLAPSIFNAADDSDEDDPVTNEEAMMRDAARKRNLKSQREQEQAILAQDPTAFDYDDVYDTMKEKTAPKKKELSKKPK